MRALVTGAGGQLGTDVALALARPGHHEVLAATRADLDVTDRSAVLGLVTGWVPELVVHTAAMTAVDACETEVDAAFAANALAARHVAEAAARVGAHLVHVSTDYVFSGESDAAYTEWDATGPRSVYGRSKLAGEVEVLRRLPGAAVVRTSWVCGVHGANMVKTVLRLAERARQAGDTLRFVDDQRGCPTFTDDLAGMLVRLGVERRPGLFHVTNQGPTTWWAFACDVVAAAGWDPGMVEPIATADLQPPRPAPRPANSVLDNAALRLAGVPLLADHHEPLTRTVATLTS